MSVWKKFTETIETNNVFCFLGLAAPRPKS